MMVEIRIIELVDDLDGGSADETVKFSLDGSITRLTYLLATPNSCGPHFPHTSRAPDPLCRRAERVFPEEHFAIREWADRSDLPCPRAAASPTLSNRPSGPLHLRFLAPRHPLEPARRVALRGRRSHRPAGALSRTPGGRVRCLGGVLRAVRTRERCDPTQHGPRKTTPARRWWAAAFSASSSRSSCATPAASRARSAPPEPRTQSSPCAHTPRHRRLRDRLSARTQPTRRQTPSQPADRRSTIDPR